MGAAGGSAGMDRGFLLQRMAAAALSPSQACRRRLLSFPPHLNPCSPAHPCSSSSPPQTPNPQADFINNFEDFYDVWMQNPKDREFDCPCKEDTRCIASIHKYPVDSTASDLAKTMRMMSARGYRAMFITDRVM